MKKISLAVVLMSALFLTGCISKRVEAPVLAILDDSNSSIVQNDGNGFSLKLPNDFEMVTDMKDGDASLYRISEKGTNPPVTKMYIEENPTPIEQAISMLLAEETVSEVTRETMTINGFNAIRLSIKLTFDGDRIVPYYFLRANKKSYVFSFARSTTWDYFHQVAESFALTE